MPIYEYQCEKCGHEFERERRISDPPIRSCPECRGRKVKKLISRTTFVLKGGGWYADGYTSKNGDAKGAASSTKDDASSEPKKTGSSESKDKSKSKSGDKAKSKAPSASSSKSAA